MLTWDDEVKRDQAGTVVSTSYKAQIPHWGTASIHPHIHYPGKMFLDCPALDIEMHPLGKVEAMDAMNPAEMVLLRALEQRAVWCLEAMVAIGSTEN